MEARLIIFTRSLRGCDSDGEQNAGVNRLITREA